MTHGPAGHLRSLAAAATCVALVIANLGAGAGAGADAAAPVTEHRAVTRASFDAARPAPRADDVTFTFTQADGPADGWTQLDTDEQVTVVGNRAQVIAPDIQHLSYIVVSGIDLTGDLQVDFDCWAPLGIGDGYVSVAVLDDTTGDGYSVVVGNAVHIYPYTRLIPGSYLTNVGRTTNADHVTFTRTAAGAMEVFLDGVSTATATDTSKATGPAIVLGYMAKNYPADVTWVDNLSFSSTITGPPTAVGKVHGDVSLEAAGALAVANLAAGAALGAAGALTHR